MKGMKKREREGRASPSPPPPTPASSSPQPLRARCRLFLLPVAVDAAVPLVACRSSVPQSLSLSPPPPSSPSSLSPPPPPSPKRVQRSTPSALQHSPPSPSLPWRASTLQRAVRAQWSLIRAPSLPCVIAVCMSLPWLVCPCACSARARRREGACSEHAHSAGARGRRRCVTHGRASALTRALRQACHAGACSASRGPSAPCMVARAWRCAAHERASSLSVIFPVSIPPLAFAVITVPRIAPHLLSWRGGGGPWYIV